MLVYENGFIRFRHEGDPEGEPVASTDDELDSVDLSRRGSHRERNGAVQWIDSGAHGTNPMPYDCCKRPNGEMATPGTPATPRSFASADFDGLSDAFSFRAPSSIHLRDSIERALDDTESCHRFNLRTPDYLDCDPDTFYSVPNTPDSALDAEYSFESLGELSKNSFQYKDAESNESARDFKCTSHHRSSKRSRNNVQRRGSSLQSLNETLATICARLDDTDGLVLRRELNKFHRYRSKSGSLTEIPFYIDDS